MFGFRQADFVKPRHAEEKQDGNQHYDMIQAETRDFTENNLTIQQMINEIEQALQYIGYVDVPEIPPNSQSQQSETSTSDIEIL